MNKYLLSSIRRWTMMKPTFFRVKHIIILENFNKKFETEEDKVQKRAIASWYHSIVEILFVSVNFGNCSVSATQLRLSILLRLLQTWSNDHSNKADIRPIVATSCKFSWIYLNYLELLWNQGFWETPGQRTDRLSDRQILF